ncbi:hypothetical protein AVEN_95649-1 [Araneus ventricosus]|uniref:Uncharacterized protein n=1 Tax=Araneus ventricosus TaxID=182803 RepID=A0A4Y2WZX4_ARAVE|nr:hypothetical protein AVEN_95649-1 [Araneus ventricosus]
MAGAFILGFVDRSLVTIMSQQIRLVAKVWFGGSSARSLSEPDFHHKFWNLNRSCLYCNAANKTVKVRGSSLIVRYKAGQVRFNGIHSTPIASRRLSLAFVWRILCYKPSK